MNLDWVFNLPPTVAEIWQSYFFQKIAFLFEIAILFCKITFFLWNPDFFIVNLIFSFSRSRIPSFTTRSSFTYNLVFLFHAGNEFNVVWIGPVATRRLRSDHGLIAMVTSWPRLFIAVAWHAMSLVCDVRVCLRCSLWEHFVWACLRSPPIGMRDCVIALLLRDCAKMKKIITCLRNRPPCVICERLFLCARWREKPFLICVMAWKKVRDYVKMEKMIRLYNE